MTPRPARLALISHACLVIIIASVGLEVVATADAHTWSQLWPWGASTWILTVVTAAVGWIISWKQSTNSLGWLLLLIAFLLALQGPTAVFGLALQHDAPRVAQWLLFYGGAYSSWSWLPPICVLFTQVPLRFPTGSLPSARWRWFSRYTIAAILFSTALIATTGATVSPGVPNVLFVHWGRWQELIDDLTFVPAVVAFGGSIASLFIRYRRSPAMQRAQLRWVFWGAALAIGSLIGSWVTSIEIWEFITGVAYSLIPLAILFAVLRYGLYSIDRIISRTASYAVVTLSIGVIYAGVIVLAGFLFQGTESDQSTRSVAVAVATLIAAAVFLPLLRAVRRVVDRRFNREQYDAQKVVEAFGERIRNGADPHTAGRDLVSAVEQTLQPEVIGVWTIEGAR